MSDIQVVNSAGTHRTIVFVHGIEGDPVSTWTSDTFSWPKHATSLNASVLSIGYASRIGGFRADMALIPRAKQLLVSLSTEPCIEESSIVMVCHSLGGLVAKQMLRHACDNGAEFGWFRRQLVGIVFVATPHTGSALASLVSAFKVFLGAGDAIEDLASNAPYALDLAEWFRNVHDHLGLKSLAFYETKPVGLGKVGLTAVQPSDANPGVASVLVVPLDENHISAPKPRSEAALQVTTTDNFLRERFELDYRLANLPRQAAAICYRLDEGGNMEVLLVKTDKGRWTFPKGKLKVGETFAEAAQREAGEEAGAVGEIDSRPITTYLHGTKVRIWNPLDPPKDKAVTAFLLRVNSPQKRGKKTGMTSPTWFAFEEAGHALSEGRELRYAAELKRALAEARKRVGA